MRQISVTALVALALAGCTTTGPVWLKAGASKQNFAVDRYECERENQGGAVAVPLGNGAVALCQ
jgi:hypothetical protein